MYRTKPRGSSGALAALLISPRTFSFCVCARCMRNLFYTYVGEDCPHCGAVVTPDYYVEGEMPDARGRAIDFRSRGPLTLSPKKEGARQPATDNRRDRGRRRSGKRRGRRDVRARVASSSLPVAAG